MRRPTPGMVYAENIVSALERKGSRMTSAERAAKAAVPEDCSSCKFYALQECRRFPPVVFGFGAGSQRWPAVAGNDWCGEWTKRP